MAFMQQSACLVVNPITVDNFAALFNCTPVNHILTICNITHVVISCLGFEGWIWILIAMYSS